MANEFTEKPNESEPKPGGEFTEKLSESEKQSQDSLADKLSDFEKQAQEESSPSLLGEFWEFLGENKKWWLMPILIVLLLFSVVAILAGTGAAPFIYTFH